MGKSLRKSGSEARRKVHELSGIHLPHWTSFLLWLIGVVILCGFTIKDLCPMISDYMDDDANSALHISFPKNSTIRVPELFICAPLSVGLLSMSIGRDMVKKKENCWECDQLRQYSWDIWSNITDPNQLYDRNVKVGLLNWTLSKIDYDVLNKAYSDWNKPIADALFQFFSVINQLDTEFYAGQVSGKYFVNDTISLMDERDDQQIDGLFDKMSSFLEDLVRPQAFLEDNGGSDKSWLEAGYDKHFINSFFINQSQQVICFQSPKTFHHFQFHVQPEFLKYTLSQTKNLIIYSDNPWHGIANKMYYTGFFDATKPKKERVHVKFSVQTSVVEKRRNKKCYSERSESDCLINCKTEIIKLVCGCSSFTTRYLTNSTLPYCRKMHYQNCLVDFQRESQKCNENCAAPCEYTTYNWQILVGIDNNIAWRDANFQVKLEAIPTTYVQFSVSVKDNIEKLISNVGGSFNFYLGLSGLSVVVLVIYIMERIRRWRRSNTDKSNTSMMPFVGWQWQMLIMKSSAAQKDNLNLSQSQDSDELTTTLEEMRKKIGKLTTKLSKLEGQVGGKRGSISGSRVSVMTDDSTGSAIIHKL